MKSLARRKEGDCQCQLPDDLLEWVGTEIYVGLVVASVENAYFAGAGGKLLSSRARTTATILLHFYGRGIYGSSEITRLLAENSAAVAWFGTELPNAEALRKFRRAHQDLIERAMATLFRAAWEATVGQGNRIHRCLNHPGRTRQGTNQTMELLTPDFWVEAQRRISEAKFHDCIDLDD